MGRNRLSLPLLLVSLIWVAAGAADAARPLPEIPDPFGLGPRLALIDQLKDAMHVAVAPGLSYDQLVALYWKTVDQPQADAEAKRQDRVEALLYRLKSEFQVDAGDCSDEAALTARLAQCERAATIVVSEPPPAPAPAPQRPVAADVAPAHAVPNVAPPTRAPAPAEDAAAGVAAWRTDYAAAVTAAQASGKPILIDFCGTDWCIWCKRLDAEVFSQAVFNDWATSHVILLLADFPHQRVLPPALADQNQALAKRFNVHGFPTVVVIAPDGHELARSGYRTGGPQSWIDDLSQRVNELR